LVKRFKRHDYIFVARIGGTVQKVTEKMELGKATPQTVANYQ
jgi:hypothetical protein